MSTFSTSHFSSPRASFTHRIKSGRRSVQNCVGNLYKLYSNMKTKCPNFDICYKLRDSRLKVCSNCFWRFENEVLETIEYMECPVCLNKGKCFKFRKCMFSTVTRMSHVFPCLKKLVVHTLMDKYQNFCIEEAQYHIRRAQELLTEGLRDPKRYYEEGQAFYKVMAKMFPLFVLLQQCNEPQLDDLEMGESLSDTQSSTQSDSDNSLFDTLPAR